MSDTAKQEAPELLPCPFCGRESKVEFFIDNDPMPWYVATCVLCPVKTYDQVTPALAAQIWNTRVRADSDVREAEISIKEAARAVYRKYGANLAAFWRDAFAAEAQKSGANAEQYNVDGNCIHYLPICHRCRLTTIEAHLKEKEELATRSAVAGPTEDAQKLARKLVDDFRFASPPVQSLRFLEWEPLVAAITQALADAAPPAPPAPPAPDSVRNVALEIAERWFSDDLPEDARVHSTRQLQLQALAESVIGSHIAEPREGI